MSGLLVTLNLQLACNLMSLGNFSEGNVTYVEDTSTPSRFTPLPDGYTAFPDIGLAYKYYENRLTWNAARKQCIAEGGNLAVIDSFKKIEYLMTVKDRSASIHVGVHRLFNNAEWVSVKSGQSLGFIPWKPEVSLAAGTGGCVSLWYDGTGLAPWDCTKVLPAVCEISLFKNYRNRTQICRDKIDAESSRNAAVQLGVENLSNSSKELDSSQLMAA